MGPERLKLNEVGDVFKIIDGKLQQSLMITTNAVWKYIISLNQIWHDSNKIQNKHFFDLKTKTEEKLKKMLDTTA